MNGINSLIEDLHNKLIKDINTCQLPVGIIYFVAKDIFKEIEIGYQKELMREKEQIEREEKDNNNDDDSLGVENHQE